LVVSDYAIIDVKQGSSSQGMVLVILNDEFTAGEIAVELRGRGCPVAVQPVEMRNHVKLGRGIGSELPPV
jgi:hypothetical protein